MLHVKVEERSTAFAITAPGHLATFVFNFYDTRRVSGYVYPFSSMPAWLIPRADGASVSFRSIDRNSAGGEEHTIPAAVS